MSDLITSGLDQGEFYRNLLEGYDKFFPQVQGLDSGEEYINALADSSVVTTNILGPEGAFHKLPQLAPLRVYPWLNAEYYATVYPLETRDDTVRHYMDMPGVIPGREVRNEIGRLAGAQGVVVFDYPNTDESYPDRVVSLIEDSGGRVAEMVQLGTQTYYAGKIHKRAGYDPDVDVISMQEALAKMRERGDIPEKLPADGATYIEQIDSQSASHLFEIYDKAFQTINDHPCRQGFTPEEFYEVMVDPELASRVGKLILNAGGEVANMVMFSHDLPFPWLSQRAYDNLVEGTFPLDTATLEDWRGGNLLYFPAIATNPDNRRGLDSQPVIDLLAKGVHESNNEVIVGFDCCDFNKDVLGLPAYIARLINNTEHAQVDGFTEIGQQRYMGVKLAPAN